MPDISMCKGTGCSAKDDCYRYRAIPAEHWQTYFGKPPGKDKECKYFNPFEPIAPVRDVGAIEAFAELGAELRTLRARLTEPQETTYMSLELLNERLEETAEFTSLASHERAVLELEFLLRRYSYATIEIDQLRRPWWDKLWSRISGAIFWARDRGNDGR